MSAGNGHAERFEKVETDHADLRQLVLDELRALRGDMKHIKEQTRQTGEAVDHILALLKLDEANDG